ncbi:uncharacterized protein ANIA_10342 [Aspergillus nidulans FGSC A4]|uniref:Uncharacterized protein n=1 Tax=Emericella nidulans (strain FGSC A4 / ATCC 38163 / CBS 112.46 / NRRL 194 / M139) TaxID=227321 RepID=C8VJN6_EMENI|nr:hypothetical protein [Aspergillus nidulans FGSC A4]CBF84057.1 TPA: hypothetical protein ANIA_10342 [Aspergillus nidulans FGSC A4]
MNALSPYPTSESVNLMFPRLTQAEVFGLSSTLLSSHQNGCGAELNVLFACISSWLYNFGRVLVVPLLHYHQHVQTMSGLTLLTVLISGFCFLYSHMFLPCQKRLAYRLRMKPLPQWALSEIFRLLRTLDYPISIIKH